MHAVPAGHNKCHHNWYTTLVHSSVHSRCTTLWIWMEIRRRSTKIGNPISYSVRHPVSSPKIPRQTDKSTAIEWRSDHTVREIMERQWELLSPISSPACTAPIYHWEMRRQFVCPSDSMTHIWIATKIFNENSWYFRRKVMTYRTSFDLSNVK